MFALLASAGALMLAQLPLPDSDFPPTIFTQHPYVAKVSCMHSSGSAFKIASGQWITAAHVADDWQCKIDGKRITVTHVDFDNDFVVLDVPDDRKGGLEVNCAGYRHGVWYWGIGHGRGNPFPQIVAGRYSAIHTFLSGGRSSILEGNRFVPGMSGGPVLDSTGRVVGVVNAFGIKLRISFSTSLSRTVLCQ